MCSTVLALPLDSGGKKEEKRKDRKERRKEGKKKREKRECVESDPRTTVAREGEEKE